MLGFYRLHGMDNDLILLNRKVLRAPGLVKALGNRDVMSATLGLGMRPPRAHMISAYAGMFQSRTRRFSQRLGTTKVWPFSVSLMPRPIADYFTASNSQQWVLA